MRTKIFAAGMAALAGLSTLGSAGMAANATTNQTPQAKAAYTRVADVPISFRVRNVNRSKVACAADGKTYTVRGHLVGPAAKVSSGSVDAATLYLHGLSFGEFFWHFQQA